MDDTIDHFAARTRSGTSLVLSLILLALAPQIFEFIWSLGTLFGWSGGRGPAQVLGAHLAALLWSAPAAIIELGGASRKVFSSDVLLALIYSYPVFAIAIVTNFLKIRSVQDFVGGVVLVTFALFALWASSDLQGAQGFSFGAGTAPRMFGVLMLGLGAAIALRSLLSDGPGLARYFWRGPLFVMVSVVFFACAIRPLGLIISAFGGFLIAAVGSHETRWIEAIVVGACLTAGCAILFPYVLGLPMPMFPRFLGP